MAYFANGAEADAYEEEYCARCLHEKGCVVWLLHLELNYQECNKPDSMLHRLIPRRPDGFAGECTMFVLNPQWNQGELFAVG